MTASQQRGPPAHRVRQAPWRAPADDSARLAPSSGARQAGGHDRRVVRRWAVAATSCRCGLRRLRREAVARTVAVDGGDGVAIPSPTDRRGDRRDAVVELAGRPHVARRAGCSRAGARSARRLGHGAVGERRVERPGQVGLDRVGRLRRRAARGPTTRRAAGGGCRSSRAAGPRSPSRRDRGTRPRRLRAPTARASRPPARRARRGPAGPPTTRPADASTAAASVGHGRRRCRRCPIADAADGAERLERAEQPGDRAHGQVDGARDVADAAGPVATAAQHRERPVDRLHRPAWRRPLSRSRRASRPCAGRRTSRSSSSIASSIGGGSYSASRRLPDRVGALRGVEAAVFEPLLVAGVVGRGRAVERGLEVGERVRGAEEVLAGSVLADGVERLAVLARGRRPGRTCAIMPSWSSSRTNFS